MEAYKGRPSDWEFVMDDDKSVDKIPIERVDLPLLGNGNGFILYNVLSPKECEQLIQDTERTGYGETNYPKSYRGNTRLMVDDKILANNIWERVKEYIPNKLKKSNVDWYANNLNKRWRYCKYIPGDKFQAHCDGKFFVSNTHRSIFTFMLYLNGGFEGGTTNFLLDNNETIKIVPTPGMALVFKHNILHEGEVLQSGVKYIMRSDVMFQTNQSED